MNSISERVKKEREARGITLEELAKGTFISVAVLKDIESGNFDKFKGDELYLKMYLRKIAKYLGLEEKELDSDFENLTQEIQLEEIRQEDLAKRLAEENKKNVTISEKVSDSLKDLKKVKSKKAISKNKPVYENHYFLRYLKYILVGVIIVALIIVIWYTLVATRVDDGSSDFNNNNSPTVEGSNETTDQNTNDTNDNEDSNEPAQQPEKTTPAVTITKTDEGDLTYNFTLAESETTVRFKVEFVGRTWARLDYNGSEYSGFNSGIYNDANRSDSLEATPETVELEFSKEEFQNLDLRIGYFMGHRFYINDTQIEIDPSEYDGGTKDLILTQVPSTQVSQ
ncbi:RodZ family helix-turn-helix domain-containing protein [uncultured Thomasclavelia sp.]|uniref:helix-turn-helix domain-containing protein n=1 Tax=uncultured Thomasclavelia sp. TaxID=3025759 RepID=UPI0025FDC597|nr:helix-turn-helix transcriptional regulator [uncultured Thomasclavelia sp.]